MAFGFKFGFRPISICSSTCAFCAIQTTRNRLLRLTGDDAAVGAFIESDPALAPFLSKITDLIDFLLPRYMAEGKSQLTVGIGCTGGRHRSVYVARPPLPNAMPPTTVWSLRSKCATSALGR